jgi:hypothetical protein
MTKTLSNDSTKKQLGFEYQKMIALEYCLNAKNGEYVYIECFGDVQHGTESVEVKHHEGNSNLTSNSVDVWETLKNLVLEYELIKSNDKFLLHTTETIQKDSIFYGWNELSKNAKYKKLKDQLISTSSKEFKDVIFDIKKIGKSDLLGILDKFIINSSQPKIEEKLEELKGHLSFDIIPENYKSDAIGIMNQWIIERAIEDSNKWEVNITDFKNDFRSSLSQFTKDYTPFPSIEKTKVNDEEINKGFRFINNLKAISLNQKDLHQAFQDYIRSEDAYEKMLKTNPTLGKELISYEDDLQDEINTEKSKMSYSLSKESFSDNSHIEKSRDVYFNCILKPHSEVLGVKGTRKYFRDGRIQNINETTDFEWKYKETDL